MSGNPETTVGNFDLSRREDCRTLAAHCKRWNELDGEFKSQCVKALKLALSLGVRDKDVRKITRVIETAKGLEAQNQADEHLAAKEARLDEGKPTERIEGQVFKLEFDKQG